MECVTVALEQWVEVDTRVALDTLTDDAFAALTSA